MAGSAAVLVLAVGYGTASAVPESDLDGTQTRYLNVYLPGVAEVTSSDVWAVGSYELSGEDIDHPLAQHFDGTRWQTVDVPEPGGKHGGGLSDVAVAAADDIWRSATYDQGGLSHGYFQHWDRDLLAGRRVARRERLGRGVGRDLPERHLGRRWPRPPHASRTT